MDKWYSTYQSQCWFRNTFLVNCYHDVAEKNNIYNSDCHFTCLAMMIDINAALLSNELSKKYYFEKDNEGLVWDINKPNEENDSIFVSLILPNENCKIIETSIKIKLVEKLDGQRCIKNAKKAKAFIKKQHDKNRHIICGNRNHSLLVAGEIDKNNYFMWDPDLSWDNEDKLLRKNLECQNNVEWLYEEYGHDGIEFWVYHVDAQIDYK